MISSKRSQATPINKAIPEIPDFLSVLLDHSHQMTFVKDKNSAIIYANNAFLELYAPDQRDHIIGAPSAENFSEEDAAVFLAEDRKALAQGYSEILEEISDFEGITRHFHTQKIRFYDEKTSEAFILGIATDVSRLVEREKQLAQSNLALDNFAAIAAHDLRSPLSSITSSLEFIDHDFQTVLGPKSKKHMRLIEICLEGLREQIASLLESCRSPTSEADDIIPFDEYDLSVLFEEARFSLSSMIEKSRAKVLSVELPRMKVNKPLFRQLLCNLMENSLKYRSKSSPIILLQYESRDGFHCFALEDNGMGIKESDKARVFELFTQSDKKNDGYGIGLSLCRNIVELHGGRIWIDAGYTSGCRVCFKIPLNS